MELLTIGAFAKAALLSPKALRLYDRLRLLVPARVDGLTGYRYYGPEQLERARLVAWLRRIGRPLARIRGVCELESGAVIRTRRTPDPGCSPWRTGSGGAGRRPVRPR